MYNKITIQEITAQFAQRSGISKKTAETFIRSFFEQIASSLSEEQYVKIKNFGTFKTIIVEERESINIKTGERFNIDKHAKITFTPDNFLKNLVNRPFSQFQSATIADEATEIELQKFEQTATKEIEEEDNISDVPEQEVLPPIPDTVTAKPQEVEPVDAADQSDTTPPPPPSPISDIPQKPQADTSTAALATPNIPEDDTNVEKKPEESEATSSAKGAEAETSKHSINYKKISAYIIGALLMFILGYLCGRSGNFESKDKPKTEKVSDTSDSLKTKEVSNTQEPDATVAGTLLSELPSSPVAKGPKGRTMKITGDLGNYELKKGEFIFRIASKVYGDADMGRYIIEYNNIQNPDLVPPGTIIKLPKLETVE